MPAMPVPWTRTATRCGFECFPSPCCPYSTDIAAQVRERPRRTLDDMRRLSEQIKRIREFARYDEPPRPASEESKKSPK